jgi:acyl-CoA dehydrogenase family member 9
MTWIKQFFHNQTPELPSFLQGQDLEKQEIFSMFYDSYKQWCDTKVKSDVFEKAHKLPAEIIENLKELGLFGMIIPEEFGGFGFTQTEYSKILSLTSQYDVSISLTIGAHSSIGLKALYLFGTQEQKALYFPKLATGEMIAAFCLTEPTAGSDVANLKTTVVKNKNGSYTLSGSKIWITNGGLASFFTVFAKETMSDGAEKISAFIVTKDMLGVSCGKEEEKMGIKASSTTEVFFDKVIVEETHRIGQAGQGFKVAMSVLNQGRLGLAAGAMGSVRQTFNEVLAYSKSRKTFGQSIQQYELVQQWLNRMVEDLYSGESMIYLTSHSLVDSKQPDYALESALCKIFATDSGCTNISNGIQLLGGNGYMVDYKLEKSYRDARISPIFEGTNEILKLMVAGMGIKELSGEYESVLKSTKQISKALSKKDFKALISKENLSVLKQASSLAIQEVKNNFQPSQAMKLHPSLESVSHALSMATQTLNNNSTRLIRQYGAKVIDQQKKLDCIASITIETFKIFAVLARIQTAWATQQTTKVSIADLEAESALVCQIIHKALDHIEQLDAACFKTEYKTENAILGLYNEAGKYPWALA